MSTPKQLFEVHRRIKIAGVMYSPGDVVDLHAAGLPAGRADQLVAQRRGEFVSGVEPVAVPDTAQTVIDHWAVSGGATEAALITEYDETVIIDEADDDGLSAPVPTATGYVRAQLEAMGRDELRDMAQSVGVAIRGTKTEIIDRLMGAGKPS
jgi:hypothetical protein